MTRVALASGAAAFGFCAGFLFCGWVVGSALKDGSMDDVIDKARAKYPRHDAQFRLFAFLRGEGL